MSQDLCYLSWNVRGLRGKLKKVQAEVMRIKAPVTVLCETRVKEWNMKSIMERCWGNLCWVSNHCKHPGGRILLLWNPDIVIVNVLSLSAQMIHCELIIQDVSFLFSVVYGFNDPEGRTALWRELVEASSNVILPWIAMGDFNAIRNLNERRGKATTLAQDTVEFNDCLTESNLIEAEYKGSWFTWDNHQMGSNLVLSKIDRVFYNQILLNRLDNAWVDFIASSVSDHRLLCLHIDLAIPIKKIPFRHFNAWSSLAGYDDVVKSAWDIEVGGCLMFQVTSKLKNVKDALVKWNKEANGDMYIKARDLRSLADSVQADFDINHDNESIQRHLKELKAAANEDETVVESYLRQKSRCIWLHEGDSNSKYFYTSMMTRRNRNVIKVIEEGGMKLTSKPDIVNHITSFYKDLYNQEDLSSDNWDFVNYIPKLSKADVTQICRWVSTDEIEPVVREVTLIRPLGLMGSTASSSSIIGM